MRILVCDDVPERGQEAKEAVDAAGVSHEVIVVPFSDFERAMGALVDHGRRFLAGEPSIGATCRDRLFAAADIDLMILDNNLTELDVGGARYTAEGLAGLVRAFTEIPYVVSLNKNPHTDFDLRYLVGDYQTVTDLALNLPHLANSGLWSGTLAPGPDSFLPWYWPALDGVATRRRRQERFVDQHLDGPMLKALGFASAHVPRLSRHARGALSPDAEASESLEAVTFGQFFVTSCRSLPIEQERQGAVERMRMKGQGAAAARRVVVRVVAAELEKWFRRDVIGPQSVLVDLPHLLARMPFLLGDRACNLDLWNAALEPRRWPGDAVEESYRPRLAAASFPHSCWTKAPCYWWPVLKADAELNAGYFRDHPTWADAVFCEDVSEFRGATSPTAPQEFAAEFEGAWSRRYVARLADKGYTPASRFAL